MLAFRKPEKTKTLIKTIIDGEATEVDRNLFIAKAEIKLLEELSHVAFLLNGASQKSFVDVTKPIRRWMEMDLKRLYELLKDATLEDLKVYDLTADNSFYKIKKRIEKLSGMQEEDPE